MNFGSLSPSANNAAIQVYINTALSAAGYTGTVTVTGAASGNGYTGDGYVVGPNGRSVTLGTDANGNPNGNFITNVTHNSPGNDPDSDRITMRFSQPIYGIQFDLQIFPDDASAAPDFTFKAYKNFGDADAVVTQKWLGVDPPGGSPQNADEKEQQLLLTGALGPTFTFPGGVTYLEFIDWPATIGINNLNLTFTQVTPNEVPEPTSILLLAGALGGLGVQLYRRRKALPASQG